MLRAPSTTLYTQMSFSELGMLNAENTLDSKTGDNSVFTNEQEQKVQISHVKYIPKNVDWETSKALI